MHFLIVASFLVGVTLGSPIGQVDVTTTLPQDLARNDLELHDATTVVVEILADDATIASATDRARQAPAPAAGTEDESNEDNEEEEATTASSTVSGGSGSGGSASSSSGSTRPQPGIPQPLANSSNFLAEYEFSSQFNLGPKDESLPLAAASGQAQPAVVEQVPQIGTPESASTPAGQAAPAVPASSAAVPPSLPPTSPPAASAASPLSAEGASANSSSPSIVAAGEDEDDTESEEATEAPSARLQQQQQKVDAQRIEESDSDNEITNDDVTTIKSFVSDYQETIQKLGTNKRVQS